MNSDFERAEYHPPANRTKVLEELYRCPDCLDHGVVDLVDPESGLPPIAAPCRHCRPISYRRWSEGHYKLDHHCPECSALRNGQIGPADYDHEGRWIGAP